MDAADLYRALLSTGRLPRLRRLTYRCAIERCLLLDAVETPLGQVLHQKRYKYSDEENERRSNEAGRARNTTTARITGRSGPTSSGSRPSPIPTIGPCHRSKSLVTMYSGIC